MFVDVNNLEWNSNNTFLLLKVQKPILLYYVLVKHTTLVLQALQAPLGKHLGLSKPAAIVIILLPLVASIVPIASFTPSLFSSSKKKKNGSESLGMA